MNVVLGTSIIVSAIWSPGRNANMILNVVFARKHTACYDYQILDEYDKVLHYDQFPFSEWELIAVLSKITKTVFQKLRIHFPTFHLEEMNLIVNFLRSANTVVLL